MNASAPSILVSAGMLRSNVAEVCPAGMVRFHGPPVQSSGVAVPAVAVTVTVMSESCASEMTTGIDNVVPSRML